MSLDKAPNRYKWLKKRKKGMKIIFFGFRFSMVLAIFATITACAKKNENFGEKTVSVEVTGAKERLFEKLITVHGTVEPSEYADLSARVEGYLEHRFVEEGDVFKKNDDLFQIDKTNIERQLKAAEEDLKVAEAELNKAKIDLEILKITFDKAQTDYERAKKLISENAISKDKFEVYELTWKKSDANVKQGEAILALSIANRDKAKSYLEIAKKRLSDCCEKAPFDGVVTQEYKQQGEFIKIGEKIIRVEKSEVLEAVAYLSSEFYFEIKPANTKARVKSGKAQTETEIYYKSPDIDTKTRTFKIKIKLPKDKGFVSGGLCLIEIIAEARTSWGVPSKAILERTEGKKTLFHIKDSGIAEEIAIQTGIEQDSWIEILEPDVRNMNIVTEGNFLLKNGDKVRIITDNKTQN